MTHVAAPPQAQPADDQGKNRVTFADRLMELRVARGLSQEQLSDQAGVSVRAISDLERAVTRRPRRDTVRALAAGLGLTGDEREALERSARQAPPSSRRGRASPRINMPAPVSSIVGRAADVAALGRLVRGAAARLVTVVGPGGVGKTRLAVEVGWRAAAAFGRVDAVDLSPLRTADDVPTAIAAGLGVPTGTAQPVTAVTAAIGDTPWLLVLDSFEHVTRAASVVAELLAGCRRLSVLVTSRAPLRLRGEHLWPLAPLPLPATDTDTDNPAFALLVERARAVRPGFDVGSENAAALAALCRGTDGLPLAIELVAAHLRTSEPADLVRQLRSRLTGLSAQAVDLPDRHQTLRATVAWSTERLGADDRLVLSALSVFAGGADPAEARTVLSGAGLDGGRLDAAVPTLAATSLLTVAHQDGRARIRMLDTIREIAAAGLAASGHDRAVRRAHAVRFLDLLRDAAGSQGQLIDGELDNVRTGIAWAAGCEPALLDEPLVRALSGYLLARSRFAEARRILLTVAEAAGDLPVQAAALHAAGIAADQHGDHHTAVTLAHRSAAMFEKLADARGRGAALTLSGNAYKALGAHEPARLAHEECLALARSAGDPGRASVALNNLGTLAHDRGDHAAANGYYQASLQLKEQLGDARGMAVGLVNLGGLANDRGDHLAARDHLRQAVERWRAIGEEHSVAFTLGMLAEAQLGAGAPQAAAAAAAEALDIARRTDHRPTIGLVLSRLGDLKLAHGDNAGAERLYGEALDFASGADEIARTVDRLAVARSRIGSPAVSA
jgi:predicted ATPase/transcriptional regulator with XRE-family HTH domain